MNLSLWILTIVIALCMALTEQTKDNTLSEDDGNKTVQAGTSSEKDANKNVQAETSSEEDVNKNVDPSNVGVVRKPCKVWITDDGFTDVRHEYNKNIDKARELRIEIQDPETSRKNIWTRGYALTILSRIDSTSDELYPNDYCIILNQNDRIYLEEVTPQSTNITCPRWLFLNGFTDDHSQSNEMIARRQSNEGVVPYAPGCVSQFVELILSDHEKKFDAISNFCRDYPGMPGTSAHVRYLTCQP